MSTIEQVRVSAPAEREQSERERRASLLEAAALEVEVRGHAKMKLMDDAGAVCAGGALACAKGWKGGHPWKLWDTLLADREDFFPDYEFLPQFNNAEETTPQQVTFLLRWRAEEIRDGR